MGERFLIDTNAVIYFLGESVKEKELEFLGDILEKECLVSFITEIELLVWGRVEEEVDVFHKFISGSTVFLIDQKIIDKTIEIRRVLKIKIPDAIIAATAIVNNLVLISYNDKDFLKMSGMGLNYLNPKNLL